MSVSVTWLGQSGVVLEAEGQAVAIDPFLSDYPGRGHRAPLGPEQLGGVTAVLVSHEHADHLDLPACRELAVRGSNLRFLLPAPLTEMAVRAGLPRTRLLGMQPGDEYSLGPVHVHAVPACHGVHVVDAYNFGEQLSHGAVRYLGYVVTLGGLSLYHAGDTIPFSDQVRTLRALHVDVALLPINGRDADREACDLVGNLNGSEAASLAADIGAQTVIPLHYELMTGNLASVGEFVEQVQRTQPTLSVVVPAVGRQFVLDRPGHLTTIESESNAYHWA
jgi:L-ascorbate metabolism protein UlaG (beta-lactamase superfamily)